MNTKTPQQSLTVWSGLAASVGGMSVVISLLLRWAGVEASEDEISILLGGLVSMVTGIISIYGRWRATTLISRRPHD